jgi:hypothetical protein
MAEHVHNRSSRLKAAGRCCTGLIKQCDRRNERQTARLRYAFTSFTILDARIELRPRPAAVQRVRAGIVEPKSTAARVLQRAGVDH